MTLVALLSAVVPHLMSFPFDLGSLRRVGDRERSPMPACIAAALGNDPG